MSDSKNATNTAGQDQEQDRRVKRQRMIDEYGFDPYGQTQSGLVSLQDAHDSYDEVADESYKADKEDDQRPVVKVAGRIVLHRGMGNLVFATLRDHTGDLQVAISKKAVDQPAFKLASKLVDLGDIVVVEGALGKTKTGEITVWAEGDGAFKIACKSLVPPPSKHQGLQDTELRYRQRYIDLWSNPEVTQTFKLRSTIIQRIREMLTDTESTLFDPFIEVETPMMQAIAGGAAARPFVTHHNALDLELYLRIAPELFLKRLLVGGIPRVFEINRNFRNEGISPKHNPEFTMLELYQAFGSYNSMMDISEYLIRTLAREIKADAVLPFNEFEIDYSKPFAKKKYLDLFAEVNGFPGSDHEKLVAKAKELHIDGADEKDHDVLLNDVWEETVEETLIQPTFVMDYPASLCPLTKCKVDDPTIAERFELFVAKMELANAYTELNDPDVQEENFKQQLDGQKEEDSMAKMDQDFVDALKVGMPPAGGLGIGIDRLVMLLTGSSSIRDVIFFPLMRPRQQQVEETGEA